MNISDKSNKELTTDVVNLKTQIDEIRVTLSSLKYLAMLHMKAYSEDMSGLQKRTDALEHPDLKPILTSFQKLRDDANKTSI
jgi:hypothetical protein